MFEDWITLSNGSITIQWINDLSSTVDSVTHLSNNPGLLDKAFYYMEESVLLESKPLVDSIRHFIRDQSGVFSVCHLCECRIVQ